MIKRDKISGVVIQRMVLSFAPSVMSLQFICNIISVLLSFLSFISSITGGGMLPLSFIILCSSALAAPRSVRPENSGSALKNTFYKPNPFSLWQS